MLLIIQRNSRAATEREKREQARAVELLTTFGNSLSTNVGNELLQIAQQIPKLAHFIYAEALNIVSYNKGAPAAKQFALHAGRIAYAANRADRAPTIYDEQAIANDIAMRIGSQDEVKTQKPQVATPRPTNPEDVSVVEEHKANLLFEEARLLVRDGQKQLAADLLKKIIDFYPNTRSAAKARKSLGIS